jgi:hypothetical protein
MENKNAPPGWGEVEGEQRVPDEGWMHAVTSTNEKLRFLFGNDTEKGSSFCRLVDTGTYRSRQSY